MNKKILLLGITTLSLTNFTLAFAAANYNVSTVPPKEETMTPYSTTKPTSYVDLISNQPMKFSGSANTQALYLEKGFTGVTGINVNVYNKSSSTLTITLYKYRALDTDVKVTSLTIPANMYSLRTIDDLSSSGKYYLCYGAPSDFEGSITSR